MYTLRALAYELWLETFLWENKKVANFFLHLFIFSMKMVLKFS